MKYLIFTALFLFLATPSTATYIAPEPPDPPTPKEYAQTLFPDEWKYFDDLIWRESKWDPKAQNPHSTAYGLGQFLNGTWETVGCVKTSDPYKQLDCTKKYIEKRYGNPHRALHHQIAHDWY